MELTALGTSGGWPGPGRAASGYLLRHDGFTIALDLGTGTLSRMQELIRLDELSAVVISHAHYDHFLDLYPLFVARYFHPNRDDPFPPLPLIAPTGFFDYLLQLAKNEGEDMRHIYSPQEVEPGQTTEVGPFRIETRPMTHLVPTIGTRIAANGKVVAYTGDTGPTQEVEVIARGADALLSEAALQDSEEPPWFHLTARQAGEHARRAEAQSLILSHFWPTHDRAVSGEQAAEAFQGPLTLLDEGTTVRI
ncbi:MAG: MBL fold metallo-hydrolase [Actinobacteria bacterium]|nr:MBL fold metallo-hydrolase [Actinomycetota bacterium]